MFYAAGRVFGIRLSGLWHHPDFVKLLSDENSHGALHLQQSAVVEQQNSPLITLIGQTLRRGEHAGLFRPGSTRSGCTYRSLAWPIFISRTEQRCPPSSRVTLGKSRLWHPTVATSLLLRWQPSVCGPAAFNRMVDSPPKRP